MTDKSIEIWLPTTETKVTVVEGTVTVWDEMTMEKRAIRKQPGFAPKPAASPDDPSNRSP